MAIKIETKKSAITDWPHLVHAWPDVTGRGHLVRCDDGVIVGIVKTFFRSRIAVGRRTSGVSHYAYFGADGSYKVAASMDDLKITCAGTA